MTYGASGGVRVIGAAILYDDALAPRSAAQQDDPRRAQANVAMDAYANGDESAFGVLYDVLAPRLYGHAIRQTRNAAIAEDIVQQTMLQIHCARDRFERGAEVLPWAFAIARRLMIDLHRKSRHRERLSIEETDGDRDSSTTESPDAILEGKQLAAVLEEALMSVPDNQREAFRLIRQEGFSVVEAAEILGTTVGAVKVRAHRAYEAMRDAMAQQERGVR